MPEIEDRLRAGLNAVADEVPASVDARAELDRRLAGDRRRVPMWAAAAAAAVVAGAVAVPIALSGNSPPSAFDSGAGAPSSSVPLPEQTFVMPPWPIAWYDDGESPNRRSVAITVTDDHEVCWQVLDEGQVWSGVDVLCEPLPDFGPDHFVEARKPSALDLPMPDDMRQEQSDHLVLLLAPDVDHVEIRRGDGTEVIPVVATHNKLLTFAVADFDGSTEGFGYTAYDEAGNVLEEAIT